MTRIDTCTVEEFFSSYLPAAEQECKNFFVKGHKLKTSSLRYQIFSRSLTCSLCGIKGNFFAIETNKEEAPHANLYAVKDGKEILMTKDHIIPTSKGGRNIPENLQTMCAVCNLKKADKI